jgi:hypothetical protein
VGRFFLLLTLDPHTPTLHSRVREQSRLQVGNAKDAQPILDVAYCVGGDHVRPTFPKHSLRERLTSGIHAKAEPAPLRVLGLR